MLNRLRAFASALVAFRPKSTETIKQSKLRGMQNTAAYEEFAALLFLITITTAMHISPTEPTTAARVSGSI